MREQPPSSIAWVCSQGSATRRSCSTGFGGLYDYDPDAVDPVPFKINIEDPDYVEKWSDEIEIYHNPRALEPLDHDIFPSVTHFFVKDGELLWHGPGRRVLFSFTRTNHFGEEDPVSEQLDVGAAG